MKISAFLAMLLFWSSAAQLNAVPKPARSLPTPLPSHPGNVFLGGEEVVVPVQSEPSGMWRVLDYEDKVVTIARASENRVRLGRLPTGFYQLQREGQTNSIFCAVLAPLKAPTPVTSPVALDVAMAWFYPKEKMADAASLCSLAGVNWVRDRLSWGQMEPRREQLAETNRYDFSAQAQAGAGLRVLQVNHSSPSWANPTTKRFPLDLRDAYCFHREIAQRWRGQVLAFEPWNEADIPMFGGHTGAEMATLQKASYLGLKAGNPDVIACLNVFASHNRAQLEDLHDNAAWPYFDTFNLHHYSPFDAYPKLYADFRAVSAGRPLWVTECALPVKWAGDEKSKEPADADLRVQAERVAKTFACSLHEGSVATFYFMLPHYVEGQTQFGLLRPDLTPRPAFVALAAVGRLLADAKPLGRWQNVPGTARGYLFSAQPGGRRREVMVAWNNAEQTNVSLPVQAEAMFDHLGRPKPSADVLALSVAPVFVVLPEKSASRFQLELPPAAPERSAGKPSPVVIQALWPEEKTVLSKSAYRISSKQIESVPLFVYNFSDASVKGRLAAQVPAGWQTDSFAQLELAPQSRTELQWKLDCRYATGLQFSETVRVTGDFGSAGQPVLSLRLLPEPSLSGLQAGTPLPGAGEARRWQTMIAGAGPMKITENDAAVVIEAEPKGSDKWVYPRLVLETNQRAPASATALCCSFTLLEGAGQFRVIFDEENGSSYVVDLLSQPKLGETVEAVALLENAAHGEGWSKPDPNQRLDPGQITAVKIGCNLKAGKVKFALKNLRWVSGQ